MMRRFWSLFLIFAVILTLAIGVSAASAPSVGTYATVTQDGRCQVNMTVQIHLDQAASDLKFPVPADATNITLNGHRVRTQLKNNSRLIDLSNALGDLVGDMTVTISYALSNVIYTTETQQLQLQLPLLNGFAYPVQALEFSVTLPGPVDAKPAFSSGYHQADIEKDLLFDYSGATVSGSSQKEMKDHETLVMTLTVPEEMFPQTRVVLPDLQALNIAMGICAALALLYWLIFLRCAPIFSSYSPTPHEGLPAGQLGCVLTLSGADLTMNILSWAQLGYILIQLDRQDRVMLHKRMDMGNERSEFERRCFKLLFGKRDTVNASGSSFGALCQKVQKMRPPVAPYFRPRSGNTLLFRIFAAAMGLLGGVSLGISLSAGAALQWFWVICLGIAGGYSTWLIHRWAYTLYGPDKKALWVALGCCGGWILLSCIGGKYGSGFLMSACQLFFGLMAAFGGRRTEEGRQVCRQILGLRRYLRKTNKQELARICEKDPDYFHTLAPYAVALGVDDSFARQFGKVRLTESPYLTTGSQNTLTAAEWNNLLKRTVSIMNSTHSQHTSSKLLSILRTLTGK